MVQGLYWRYRQNGQTSFEAMKNALRWIEGNPNAPKGSVEHIQSLAFKEYRADQRELVASRSKLMARRDFLREHLDDPLTTHARRQRAQIEIAKLERELNSLEDIKIKNILRRMGFAGSRQAQGAVIIGDEAAAAVSRQQGKYLLRMGKRMRGLAGLGLMAGAGLVFLAAAGRDREWNDAA
jgi:hypothetical protein